MDTTDAVRRLEYTVDIITDMSSLRKCQQTSSNEREKHEISPAVIQEAIEGFDYFDKDNDHGLNQKELGLAMRALGQNPTEKEIEEILKSADLNKNGRLEKDEFQRLLMTYVKPPLQVEQELKEAFRTFDRDGSGAIDFRELETVLKNYGEPLTHKQARDLITMMDVDGNDRVDINDFVKFLCQVSEPDYFKKLKEEKWQTKSHVQFTL